MRTIDLMESVVDIFNFKVVRDECGNEYVLYGKSGFDSACGMNITDRTEFEAVENRTYIANNVKKSEFGRWIGVMNELGGLLADRLRKQFPQKKFIVFVTVSLNDSAIIRFHQRWHNELPYYDVSIPCSDGEYLASFE